MRFVNSLSNETISLLNRIHQHSRSHRARQRAQCILLSHQGFSIPTLIQIFSVTQITIYNWFNAWDDRGVASLYDRKGKGRKPELTSSQKEQIKAWAKTFPKQLGKIGDLIEENFGLSVSKRTIQRVLKEFNFSWRRIRRKPKGQPDPVEYQLKKQELEVLKEQERQGFIDLYYCDESGFCLTPYIPYAWQEKGQTLEVESSNHGQRLNALGFLSRTNKLHAYTTEDGVNSEVVIACFDDFCQKLTKRTVVVIDQASFHRSRAFKAKVPHWKEKGLEIFYLPPYSPELNLIEILWRFMKYEWIDFQAYKNWNSLVQYVEKILRSYGSEYQINFG